MFIDSNEKFEGTSFVSVILENILRETFGQSASHFPEKDSTYHFQSNLIEFDREHTD